MTVLGCLDSLAVSLTKPDLLPDGNHERCMDIMVCTLTHSHGCLDGWTDLFGSGRWRNVGQYSLLLSLFSKRRKWRDRSSNASVSLSPEWVCGLVEKGHINRQRAQGADWPLMKPSEPCLSDIMNPLILRHGNSPRGGRQRALHFRTHLRSKDTPAADDVAQKLHNQSKLFGSH